MRLITQRARARTALSRAQRSSSAQVWMIFRRPSRAKIISCAHSMPPAVA